MDELTIIDGWLKFITAAVTAGFIAYLIGYRSGKDRALRDNRDEKIERYEIIETKKSRFI